MNKCSLLRCAVFLAMTILGGGLVYADYKTELQDQMAELNKNYPQLNREYFRDAAILVRKADDAGLYDMAAEMTRTLLLKKMVAYDEAELTEINALYETDAFTASRRLQNLIRFERFYEPSEEFLKTALAQGIYTSLVQLRDNASNSLKKECSHSAILKGIDAVNKSSLFITRASAEISSLRELNEKLGCCLSWRPEIELSRKQDFETDYEAGTLEEKGHLRLESSRTDWTSARWAGEFVYRFTGREGEGQGVSQAVLTYHKGQDEASLVITTSRVTSTGRMNFPNALSGENRTLEVEGNPVSPRLNFFDDSIPLHGCKE